MDKKTMILYNFSSFSIKYFFPHLSFNFSKIQQQKFQYLIEIDLNKMIQNYLGRLIQLQDDRSKFQKQRDKNNYTSKMNRQESKYHAYIIDQMNQKNKIISTTKLVNILQGNLLHVKNQVFKQIHNWEVDNSKVIKFHQLSELDCGSQQDDSLVRCKKEQSISVEDMLLRVSMESIVRVYRNNKEEQMKMCFRQINSQVRRERIMNKMVKNMQKYAYRHAFRSISQVNPKRQSHYKTQVKIFDEQFSAIYKNQRPKGLKSNNKLQQSYMSFIFQKQKQIHNGQCQSCKQQTQLTQTFKQQISTLKKQLSFIKILLSDKTLELRKKIEECELIRHQIDNKQNRHRQSLSYDEVSQCFSKNQSYYNDLQRHVLGGKRIRKNRQRLSQSNLSGHKQEISKQLLGKYMRQSFQLRQNIDIACQICYDLQSKLNGDNKRKVNRIIKVLISNSEESLIDQF